MKIYWIFENRVTFDNGDYILVDHCPDCCENNYADFSIIAEKGGRPNKNVINIDHDFKEIHFKKVDGQGFKFGEDGHWIFIPCYTEQNGYYSDKVDVYYCKHELTVACDWSRS